MYNVRNTNVKGVRTMKKAFCVMLCMMVVGFAMTGCNESADVSELNEIKTEYLAMLQEQASPESVDEIVEFLDENLNRFDTESADQMVMAFADYLFAFEIEEPRYRELLERYEDYISDALARLYMIKAEEIEFPAVLDNVLQLTWEQLCERALYLELFIRELDNALVSEVATRIFEDYIRLMLMGVAGTPIFDSDGVFESDAQAAYRGFIVAYPDTTVAEILIEFMSYLVSIDFRLDFENIDEMLSFSDMCSLLILEAGKRVFQ